MLKPVLFHPAADAEANAAWQWYQERSETASSRFFSELAVAIENIQTHPLRYPLYPGVLDYEVRYRSLKRFPYAVVFEILNDRIHVLAVAHVRRRPAYWQERGGRG
ncbi:type II toxin-antitoxin system RelE/ParE family toxin [Lignipirellula cremea]|uniref:Plasmid stabilization system protein n=1 Tax=Lignipirellula cremea TaxID=2528010 RepID=A0A518E3C8_9BACT|nr:type II toxin-antitoxin system RelE/ParE family toxin [Lignipirellula cremea]QDU98596.1 Plasmid stabilization system protein [Lignipirellula cremea]